MPQFQTVLKTVSRVAGEAEADDSAADPQSKESLNEPGYNLAQAVGHCSLSYHFPPNIDHAELNKEDEEPCVVSVPKGRQDKRGQ